MSHSETAYHARVQLSTGAAIAKKMERSIFSEFKWVDPTVTDASQITLTALYAAPIGNAP